MLEERNVSITCIACPRGCQTTLTVRDGEVVDVEGAQCKRGRAYVIQEHRHPVRVLTTTIKVEGDGYVPVRTRGAVPKEAMFPIMAVLGKTTCRPPVSFGQVVVRDILGTGVDVVTTAECGPGKAG